MIEPNTVYDIEMLIFDIGLRAAQQQRACPHCGKPMETSTPAMPASGGIPSPYPAGLMPPTYDASADRGVVPVKQANVRDEDKPSGWRDREPLL